jgi:hypothetical protein
MIKQFKFMKQDIPVFKVTGCTHRLCITGVKCQKNGAKQRYESRTESYNACVFLYIIWIAV